MKITRSGLYNLFIKEDKSAWSGVVVTALFAGLLQGVIILLINQIAGNLANGGLHLRYLLLIVLALVAYALASYHSTSRTIALAQRATTAKYLAIADRLRRAGTIGFESIGKGRIYSTLQANTDIIIETSKSLASVGAGIVMIAFCAVYIAYMSKVAIIIVVIFYLFGIFVFATNLKRAQGTLREAREQKAGFIRLFRHFLEGFKEIKVNQARGNDLFDNHLREKSGRADQASIKAECLLSVNSVFVQAFYYAMIASTLVLLAQLRAIETLTVLKITAVVLFSYGSMSRIVMSIPLILKAESAVAGLDGLENDLAKVEETDTPSMASFQVGDSGVDISLREVRFSYPDGNDKNNFTLGSVDLDIKAGETVFIVGGNGSGKTTLLKLLCGLYRPDSGSFSVNGEIVIPQCYRTYRNIFSIIFSDFCIFDRFYGQDVNEQQVEGVLMQMGLQKHVHRENGRFAELKLSSGQRKRLALVCAHIESHPMLVVDEVAADLDPGFRRYFYETYLAELKAIGKTVIAVTHDEKFFHLADRVLTCEDGKVFTTLGDEHKWKGGSL
jgi:putative ATP-binding cassette transporter